MIVVDTSVWIAYFRGAITPQTTKLDEILGHDEIAMGDLILVELLQGIDSEREFNRVRKLLSSLPVIDLGGEQVAIQAARNFRSLRRLGLSVRKTIDVIIATRCIVDGHSLLHDDRDFDHFARHLGLDVLVCR